VVCLHYGHKPGMSRSLNGFVAELCRADARLVGLATVFPGEPDASLVIEEAARLGLRGIKLHCHVQGFAPDSDDAGVVFEAAERLAMPVVIHAGREPKSPAYPVDTYAVCGADRMARVLERFPRLRVCVPHFGADEVDAYGALLEKHDNLYLDTTMMLGRFFPGEAPFALLAARPERILYGTDFPNLPYAWDREIRALAAERLRDDVLARVLSGTANELFALG
jgi:predicted TIM-barrel fold metal-dependent hydrolase